MKPQSQTISQSGFTLLGGLVAMTVIIFVSLILFRLFSSQTTFLFALDKKEKAVEIANSTIGKIARLDFNDLLALCANKKVLEVPQPVTGECSVQGKLNPNPPGSTDLVANQFQLEVLRSWSGDNNSNGNVCVELAQCKSLAENHFLDVGLNVYFKTGETTRSRLITFRRTRW